MSPRKKANESEQAAELEGGTATTNAATTASSRAGSFDILELNDLERGITPEDSEDVKWNYLSGALHTRKILTGVVSGIEPQENGNIFCAIDFEGIRVLIPGNEMFMDSWPEGTSPPIRYQIRLNRILGATIDFMLAGVDFVNRAAVGSRRAALMQRQARYYATERVKVGSRVACRVIGVGNNRITVEAIGVDVEIPASNLSWQWFSDVSDLYATGDLVVAKVMEIGKDEETGGYSAVLSVKAASENPDLPSLKKLVPGSNYYGVVTGVRDRVIFIRLQTGANAKTMTYRTREIPAKLDTVSFLVRSVDLEAGMAFGLVTRIIKKTFQIEVSAMQGSNNRNLQHCREVIRACLNTVEERGDTYVAIHKDEDTECVIIVSMIRTQPILSVIVADKILFAEGNEQDMYRTANELNSESVTGWHTIVLTNHSSIYMYRQCLWITEALSADYLTEILCDCITEYKFGRSQLTPPIN